MKRAFLTLLTLSAAAVLAGCSTPHGHSLSDLFRGSCADAPENCQSCSEDVGCGEGGCQSCEIPYQAGPTPGPPTGAVAYPYYTTRGPRDFLATNPSSIGP